MRRAVEGAVADTLQIAVVSTTPWDSYLIRNRVWTYPSHVIIGPTLFQIPVEEVFFFVIQTYNTSLLYLFFSKPTFHPVYLRGERLLRHGRHLFISRWLGTLAVAAGIAAGIWLVTKGGEGLYMGLILIWSGPFILLLWYAGHYYKVTTRTKCTRSLAHQLIIELPLSNTLLPIALPTCICG